VGIVPEDMFSSLGRSIEYGLISIEEVGVRFVGALMSARSDDSLLAVCVA
jgi:hypothetical protein